MLKGAHPDDRTMSVADYIKVKEKFGLCKKSWIEKEFKIRENFI